MSFAEFMAEIPRLTREQLRQAMARVAEAEKSQATKQRSVYVEEVDGQLLIGSSETIRQEEVDRILGLFR
jgi:hypothetical protein